MAHSNLPGEQRNLHDTLKLAGPNDLDGPQSGDRRPFMQSLTSMHHSPTRVEADVAARRRAEWLRELEGQVRARDAQRLSEKAEREIEELKEELRAREWREGADQQLASALQQAGIKKSSGLGVKAGDLQPKI